MGPRSGQYDQRGGRQDDRDDRPAFQPPSDAEMERIIIAGDVDALVELADKVGLTLKNQNLTTSQMRNVFGTVRQIQMRWSTDSAKSYRDAVLLRPKLAYFAEREKRAKGGGSVGMETLQKVLEPALKLLNKGDVTDEERQKRFDRFAELFEAIVAYHKKYGGRNN